MNRRLAGLVVGAAAAVVLAAVLVMALARRPAGRPRSAAETPPPPAASAVGSEPPVSWEARLYFPTAEGRLALETRRLATPGTPRHQVAGAVEALLAGPQSAGRLAVFPVPVRLVTAVVTREGVAYLDLRSEDGGEPPPCGSEEEMLRIFSLVDSVVESVPEVERVVLLWNGSQRPSLAGHIDTGGALLPNRRLIAANP